MRQYNVSFWSAQHGENLASIELVALDLLVFPGQEVGEGELFGRAGHRWLTSSRNCGLLLPMG
jgi:hypothetical protein